MRKKTEPHIRKQHKASSCAKSGLIAKNQDRKQSAEAEPVLDNRSHRTFPGERRAESRAKHGEGVSTPFPTYPFPRLRGKRAKRALREITLLADVSSDGGPHPIPVVRDNRRRASANPVPDTCSTELN